MQPGQQPMQPDNIRSRALPNTLEFRKLWSVQEGDYFYMLVQQYETQTATARTEDGKPDWDGELETTTQFGPAVNQGYAGDEEWAKKNAEHFNLAVPTEEYKDEEATA